MMNTKHGKIDVSLDVSLDFLLDVLLGLPHDLIWDPLEPCKTLWNPLQREKKSDRQTETQRSKIPSPWAPD